MNNIKNLSRNLAEILDLLDAFESDFELILSDDDDADAYYSVISNKAGFISAWKKLSDVYASSLAQGLCPVIYIEASRLAVDMCTINGKLDFGFKLLNHKGNVIDRFMIKFKDIRNYKGIIEKQPYPPDADYRNLAANYLS